MTATAHASSSSVTNRPELDLVASGRLAPIPTAWLAEQDLDLLAPLKFLNPGQMPSGPPPAVDRRQLAAALEAANASYGHPRAAELARRLADPATRVVVTGQQPGLYGGPLLTLTKMIAAARWAEALEASGEPAVAVFWVATEDHDWAETARACFLHRQEVKRFDLGPDSDPLMPLGMRTFGAGLAEIEASLGELVSAATVTQLGRWYRPDARFGEAFSRLMVDLLGERTPLLLDSMLPALKQQQRPWLEKLVDARDELEELFIAADAAVESRGYPLQVKPQRGASPLFLYQGRARRRIEWTRTGYRLRGLDGSDSALSELRAALSDNPAVVSPGVLARPAIQDAVLGTTLQVMGPAEISYLAQARAVYQVLGIEAPWTSLRPQLLILEERQASQLEEIDISLAELVSASPQELVAARLGDDFVTPIKLRLEAELEALKRPVLELDATLERPWRKTRDQVTRAVDQLAAKVTAAEARRHGMWTRRVEQLREAVLPAGHLQERELSVAHYLARFGPGFVSAMWEQMELDPRRLRAVVMPHPSADRSAEAGS